MKEFLFFLGSGASVPFGLPTMKEMANEFEEYLDPNSPIQKKYEYLKVMLSSTYDYVDIESIFSVVEAMSREIRYSDLGFAASIIFGKVGVNNCKEKAFRKWDVEEARDLSKRMREFVRKRCILEDSEEVDNLVSGLYGKILKLFALDIRSDQ